MTLTLSGFRPGLGRLAEIPASEGVQQRSIRYRHAGKLLARPSTLEPLERNPLADPEQEH